MKSKPLRCSAAIGALAGLGLIVPGCVVVQPEPRPPEKVVVYRGAPPETETIYLNTARPGHVHEYYFYPDVDVYYDPVAVHWFWREKGGWHSGRYLPRQIRVQGHSHIFVRTDAPHPYDVHDRLHGRIEAHRKAPPGRGPEHPNNGRGGNGEAHGNAGHGPSQGPPGHRR
ncbi:MAG: hypothetical protein M1457_06555 [bacterium]|nr:hypothetical protein [bacterium]